MFGLHLDGAEAGDVGVGVCTWPGLRWEKAYGESGEGEIQIAAGGFVEDGLRFGGRLGDGGVRDGPEKDVEFGLGDGQKEARVGGEAGVHGEGGGAAGFEAASERAAEHIGQQALGRPEHSSEISPRWRSFELK